MNQDSYDYLAKAIREIEAEELSFLRNEFTRARDALADGRPHLAEVYNALLGTFDDDRLERPGRARAEVAELEQMVTDHENVDDPNSGFGWTGDRNRIE